MGGWADGQMGGGSIRRGSIRSRGGFPPPFCPSAHLPIVLLLLSCNPATTRPDFGPVPDAAEAEVDLPMADATRALAEALVEDSIPVTRIEARDGYVETGWFEAASGQPTSRRRLGPEVVRVRGWVDPIQTGQTRLRIETVIRPMADPSLPERELDRGAPMDNAAAVRVQRTAERLAKRYPVPGAASVPVPVDSAVKKD
jgi:hypothetical protein